MSCCFAFDCHDLPDNFRHTIVERMLLPPAIWLDACGVGIISVIAFNSLYYIRNC